MPAAHGWAASAQPSVALIQLVLSSEEYARSAVPAEKAKASGAVAVGAGLGGTPRASLTATATRMHWRSHGVGAVSEPASTEACASKVTVALPASPMPA